MMSSNSLLLNAEKTEMPKFGLKWIRNKFCDLTLNIAGSTISQNLGVPSDPNLTFDKDINITKTAYFHSQNIV